MVWFYLCLVMKRNVLFIRANFQTGTYWSLTYWFILLSALLKKSLPSYQCLSFSLSQLLIILSIFFSSSFRLRRISIFIWIFWLYFINSDRNDRNEKFTKISNEIILTFLNEWKMWWKNNTRRVQIADRLFITQRYITMPEISKADAIIIASHHLLQQEAWNFGEMEIKWSITPVNSPHELAP